MTDLSISQLEQLIETQKNRVRDLNAKRKFLVEQIGEVELEINSLTGRKKRRKRRSTKVSNGVSNGEIGARVRHREGKRLIDYIVSSLENSPATLDGLVEEVAGAGYKFRAKTPTSSIYKAIYEHRREGNDNVQYHRATKTYSVAGELLENAMAPKSTGMSADEVLQSGAGYPKA